MKIVAPIEQDQGMRSRICAHFGQTPLWAVYDTGSKKLEVITNAAQHGGGGCQAVSVVADMKPDILYTNGMGAKAIDNCAQMGIQVKTGDCQTVQDIVDHIDDLGDMTSGCAGQHH